MVDARQSLWASHFINSSRLCEIQERKTKPGSSRIKSKQHKTSSLLDDRDTPPCNDQELRRTRLSNINHVTKEAINIIHVLKDCAKQKDLGRGSHIHLYVKDHEFLEKNCYVAGTLIYMYAGCGALLKAQEVLDELPVHVRSVVTWTALIAGYVQQGQGQKALDCFNSMQCEGLSPNSVTFTCALKACGSIGAVAIGEQIHDRIIASCMLEKNVVLGSSLVDMYARCGSLTKAQKVLNELPISARNVVTWTALIAGYSQQGQGEDALKCFDSMQHEGHTPNAVSFTCALKACGNVHATAKGKEIHEQIVSLGMLDRDIVLGSTLVDMYARCGEIAKAHQVLDELLVRGMVAWTALIAGYTEQGQGEEALNCFDSMQCEGHSPDVVTFTWALKACGSVGAVGKGQQIHDKINALGLLEKDVVLGSTLVDMYARFGDIVKAQKVLYELPVQSVFAWNALMVGYAQHGQVEESLKCFEIMQREGHAPDAVSFTCALKACAGIGAVGKGKQIHDKIKNLGMLQGNILLGNALVDMYAKCGALAEAQHVLSEIPLRDVVTWNALLAGYAQQGQSNEALKCFDSMQQEGHAPDDVTFTCALKACGHIGSLVKAEQIHYAIISVGLLENNVMLGNTLVDMYANCGTLAKAQETFDELSVLDVVTWTVLIAGYAQHGHGEKALACFERMQYRGVGPESATLIHVLNACSHSGLMDEAEIYFSRMHSRYGITADIEHYSCMADVFSRAGKLDKAITEFEKMSPNEYLPFWLALLGACRKWGDLIVGKLAFKHALHLDKNEAAVYVSMASIYPTAGLQDDGGKVTSDNY